MNRLVVLYNQSGACIRLSMKHWHHLLALAKEHGWRPAGTRRPPLGLDNGGDSSDGGWDGNYACPAGQSVARGDGAALATALIEASRETILCPEELERLTSLTQLCSSGSFLICAGSASAGGATAIDETGSRAESGLAFATRFLRPTLKHAS